MGDADRLHDHLLAAHRNRVFDPRVRRPSHHLFGEWGPLTHRLPRIPSTGLAPRRQLCSDATCPVGFRCFHGARRPPCLKSLFSSRLGIVPVPRLLFDVIDFSPHNGRKIDTGGFIEDRSTHASVRACRTYLRDYGFLYACSFVGGRTYPHSYLSSDLYQTPHPFTHTHTHTAQHSHAVLIPSSRDHQAPTCLPLLWRWW
jgi:hypothetical protein|mmetsp:Transcript_70059/g.116791  ORF Transcript_70059/g.116791 Transcript_70059/m.116791 type:complete len:200 (+) Transcript_70059:3839-4438(+)